MAQPLTPQQFGQAVAQPLQQYGNAMVNKASQERQFAATQAAAAIDRERLLIDQKRLGMEQDRMKQQADKEANDKKQKDLDDAFDRLSKMDSGDPAAKAYHESLVKQYNDPYVTSMFDAALKVKVPDDPQKKPSYDQFWKRVDAGDEAGARVAWTQTYGDKTPFLDNLLPVIKANKDYHDEQLRIQRMNAAKGVDKEDDIVEVNYNGQILAVPKKTAIQWSTNKSTVTDSNGYPVTVESDLARAAQKALSINPETPNMGGGNPAPKYSIITLKDLNPTELQWFSANAGAIGKDAALRQIEADRANRK